MSDKHPDVIRVIESHRTIRKYMKKKIPNEHINLILKAGIRAPSSANLQSYSIIRVVNEDKKRKLAKLSGDQEHIVEAAEFLIFICDTRRLIESLESLGYDTVRPNFYMLYVSAVDAAIAAQNMVLVAETLGYGTCYIGGVQNNPCKISKLLKLPVGTYPLFGLTIGYPMEEPKKKVRLPIDIIIHLDEYDLSNAEKAFSYYKMVGFIDSYIRRLLRYYHREGRFNRRYGKMKECLRNNLFNI